MFKNRQNYLSSKKEKKIPIKIDQCLDVISASVWNISPVNSNLLLISAGRIRFHSGQAWLSVRVWLEFCRLFSRLANEPSSTACLKHDNGHCAEACLVTASTKCFSYTAIAAFCLLSHTEVHLCIFVQEMSEPTLRVCWKGLSIGCWMKIIQI